MITRRAYAPSAGVVVLLLGLAESAQAAAPKFVRVPEDVLVQPHVNDEDGVLHFLPVTIKVHAINAAGTQLVPVSMTSGPVGTSEVDANFDPETSTFTWTPSLGQACLDTTAEFLATDGTDTTQVTIVFHVLSDEGNQYCVSGMFPEAGPTTGGTPVTLYGNAFLGRVRVTFDGVKVVDFDRVSPNKLTFDTPAAPEGDALVEVTTLAGNEIGSSTFEYLPAATSNAPPVFAPGATDVFLVEGDFLNLSVRARDPEGQEVTLSAANLPAENSVFETVPGVLASGSLRWTPPQDSHGDYLVKFYADDGVNTTLSVVEIHVLNPRSDALPRIAGIVPNEGPRTGGTLVTLWGEGLTPDTVVAIGARPVLDVQKVTPYQWTFVTAAAPSSETGQSVTICREPTDPATPCFSLTQPIEFPDTLVEGWGWFVPPAAPTVSIEDVSIGNQTHVTLAIDGKPDALAKWTISDTDPNTWDVTGKAFVDALGNLEVPVDLSELNDGNLTVSAVIKDNEGPSAPTVTTAVKDTIAPVLSLPTDISRVASSTAGEVVNYTAPTATDARDGDVEVTCTPASGSVFPLGTTTVNCSATDDAGNVDTGSFTVTRAWSWSGSLAPIVDGGTYKLGRVLPLKFALTGASSGATDVTATVTLRKVSDGVPGTPIDAQAPGEANTGNQFRYDASTGLYTFNLATKGLSQGTWVVEISLGDDVAHSITIALAN